MDEQVTQPAEKPADEALKAEIAALREENSRVSRDLAEKVGQIAGQVSTLAAFGSQTVEKPEVEEPLDVINDTQKALDQHFQKRAGPILAQQTANAVATQKELVSLKRNDDWKEFGGQVEDLIKQNRIDPSTLAVPGTYEQLLDLVKSKNVEAIAERRAQALFEAHKAKSATAGAPSGSASAPPGASKAEPELTDKERFILAKLKVDPKRAIEVSKNVEYDGVRLSGEVNY